MIIKPRHRNAPPSLERGTTVAGYCVESVLGSGGMAVVYKARQQSLNRRVALKLIAPELSNDRAFAERFRREGLAQAALEHPHVLPVYEAGKAKQGLFLAMRLVRGPTLKELIALGTLDFARTLALLASVADALDAAHAAGLVHRDVKPQNILIDAGDHAYLTDFGLTKSPSETTLTGTGQFLGSIHYAAPEQIRGAGATAATDVYGLAAVLYECVAGRPPFSGLGEAATIFAHLSEPPPPLSGRVDGVPATLDEVLSRGMAKDAGARHASAGDLLDHARRALEPQLDGSARARRAPSAPPTRAPAIARAGAAVASPNGTRADDALLDSTVVPGQASRAGRGRLARAGATALAASLGIAAGAVVAEIRSDGGAHVATASASAGQLALEVPSAWTPVASHTRIAGLRFEQPLQLAPARRRNGSTLIAGNVAAEGASLLPGSFERRLGGEGRPEAVRLGSLQAYRYGDIRPRPSRRALTLYVIPTTAGVATLACVAAAGEARSFLPSCERLAGRVRLNGPRPFPVYANPAYAAAVDRATVSLNVRRSAARARLSAATTADGSAKAALAAADAYRLAARALGGLRVSPALAREHERLVQALGDSEGAYRALARTSGTGRLTGYRSARGAVVAAEAGVQRALTSLAPFGYRIE